MPLDVTSGISDFHDVTAQYLTQERLRRLRERPRRYAQHVDKAGSSLAVLPGRPASWPTCPAPCPGGVQALSVKPSGTVTFTVGGASVGSAPIAANGRATLNVVVPPGAPRLDHRVLRR